MKVSTNGYTHSSHYFPAYPNEADTNYYKKKLIDILAALTSGAALTFSLVILARFA